MDEVRSLFGRGPVPATQLTVLEEEVGAIGLNLIHKALVAETGTNKTSSVSKVLCHSCRSLPVISQCIGMTRIGQSHPFIGGPSSKTLAVVRHGT